MRIPERFQKTATMIYHQINRKILTPPNDRLPPAYEYPSPRNYHSTYTQEEWDEETNAYWKNRDAYVKKTGLDPYTGHDYDLEER